MCYPYGFAVALPLLAALCLSSLPAAVSLLAEDAAAATADATATGTASNKQHQLLLHQHGHSHNNNHHHVNHHAESVELTQPQPQATGKEKSAVSEDVMVSWLCNKITLVTHIPYFTQPSSINSRT